MLIPLPLTADAASKREQYSDISARIKALLTPSSDAVAAMATVVCELHHGFQYYDWTGFYRVVSPELLQIGPYQGGHGCIDIPFSRGVCGASARSRQTQRIADVHNFPDHIACSSSTLSEIVVPVLDPTGKLIAVFDVDSNQSDAFDAVDQEELEQIMDYFGSRFPNLT